MKRLLLILVFALVALPCLAADFVWDQKLVDGDTWILPSTTVHSFPSWGPTYAQSYRQVWLRLQTTDRLCDMYRITIRYTVQGQERSSILERYSMRLKDYGYIGNERDPMEQYEIHAGFKLPFDSDVFGLTVEKIQLTKLGAASFAKAN